MSENLVVPIARRAEFVATIEALGAAVETTDMGDAELLTCRKDKAAVSIRLAQPRDWKGTPVLRDHTLAVVMVGSLLHRAAAKQLRDDIVTACAGLVIPLDDLVEEARAALEDQSAGTT